MRLVPEPEFFVGYLPAGGSTRRFAVLVSALLLIAAGALALSLGATVEDPGNGGFGEEVTLTGVLESRPYPLLRLPPGPLHPNGHAVLLSGDGKFGVSARPGSVEARGFVLKRGSLDMLVVASDAAFKAKQGEARAPAAPISLGTWRVTGEICDGKCRAGAMRPGQGLAHKACANLCISGGVPPVLVTTSPVEGHYFLLLADAGGGPMPIASLDLVARPVALEGEIERRDDLLIFRVDWSKARLL